MDIQIKNGLRGLEDEFGQVRVQRAIEAVQKFQVEVPSWVFGDFGGGRFSGYMPPGPARNLAEKLDDAAEVHRLTGATERVAMHVLWDFSEDGIEADQALAVQAKELAEARGLQVGAINPTYFLKGSHQGSLSSPDADLRQRYIDQTIQSAQIAKELGNNLVTLWFHDGSLYPGQVDLAKAYTRLRDSLIKIMKQVNPDVTMLIEYKLFEPGTYSTVIPDWGTAYMLAKEMGTNAGVLVDMGHHAHGVNIEQIVSRLIAQGVKGGFHFNTRYAADDDHAVAPDFQMVCLFNELVSGDVLFNPDTSHNWPLMIDQCSGRENRMHAILHSVDSLQHALARAMLLDKDKLSKCQDADEILLANRLLNDVLIHADVRPLLAAARLERNLPIDLVQAYVESGYQKKIEAERK